MKRTIVGHNVYAFDCIALARDGVQFGSNVEDSLLAHHAYASHFPQRLDHVASMYCDADPWKMEFGRRGGKEEKGLAPHLMDPSELTRYNQADCRMEISTWNAMQPDLESERRVYEHDKRLAHMCARMQVAGIRIDVKRRDEISAKLKEKSERLLGEMRALCKKKDFHPHKLADLRAALYGKFRAPVTMPTKTGQPSTAVSILQAMRSQDTRAGHLADLVLQWRGAAKVRSTYLESLEIHPDGRVHATWKAFGTVNGRLSCRLQQLPRVSDPKNPELEDRVREIYIPAPGRRFVYFDLSQAEMRGAAQLSGDPNFIKATLEKDVHAANAKICFASVPGAVDALNTDPKGAGKMYRDIAKNVGFAVNYLASDETLFLWMQGQKLSAPISMAAVRAMLRAIHGAFRQHFKFIERNILLCQKQGYLRSPLLGRIRWFGWYPKPTDIANFPVQTFVADLMNERLMALCNEIDRRGWWKRVWLVAQIHDAAIFDCDERYVERLKELIRETWAEPVTLLESGRTFTMPCDLKDGMRWSDFC